jgi:hypothetical protein
MASHERCVLYANLELQGIYLENEVARYNFSFGYNIKTGLALSMPGVLRRAMIRKSASMLAFAPKRTTSLCHECTTASLNNYIAFPIN